jgi:hypothetical protein
MSVGARVVDDRERCRPTRRMRDVITMVRAIKVFSVPTPIVRSGVRFFGSVSLVSCLQGEDNVRPNAPRARLLWEVVSIPLGVHTGRIWAAAKVGLREATVTLLHLPPQTLRRASRRISSKHAKALDSHKPKSEGIH